MVWQGIEPEVWPLAPSDSGVEPFRSWWNHTAACPTEGVRPGQRPTDDASAGDNRWDLLRRSHQPGRRRIGSCTVNRGSAPRRWADR